MIIDPREPKIVATPPIVWFRLEFFRSLSRMYQNGLLTDYVSCHKNAKFAVKFKLILTSHSL